MTDSPATFKESDTIQVVVSIDESLSDLLVAEMDELGFQTFESEQQLLKAYIPGPKWSAESRAHLIGWLSEKVSEVAVVENVIQQQNWNAAWEAAIEPVVAGTFVVLPTWKAVPDHATDLTPIWIDPKMSFGTGHHETTRLMLQLMNDISFQDTDVLDAGTGTGVLAIAAKIMHAKSVHGFDIDPWSVENGYENVATNKVTGITLEQGSIEIARGRQYDVILANIVQNVIESFLPDFRSIVKPSGDLLISGILKEGEARLLQMAADTGFELRRSLYENEWAGFHFVRPE